MLWGVDTYRPGDAARGDRKALLSRIAAVLLGYAVAAVQALFTLNLLCTIVKVHGGLIAFAALGGIVALGVVVIVVAAGLPALYAQARQRGALAARVCLVSSVQAFLFPALHAARILVLPGLRPDTADYVVGGAGLAAGVLLAVLARLTRRRHSAPRSAPPRP